jgi:hypothetical protein
MTLVPLRVGYSETWSGTLHTENIYLNLGWKIWRLDEFSRNLVFEDVF